MILFFFPCLSLRPFFSFGGASPRCFPENLRAYLSGLPLSMRFLPPFFLGASWPLTHRGEPFFHFPDTPLLFFRSPLSDPACRAPARQLVPHVPPPILAHCSSARLPFFRYSCYSSFEICHPRLPFLPPWGWIWGNIAPLGRVSGLFLFTGRPPAVALLYALKYASLEVAGSRCPPLDGPSTSQIRFPVFFFSSYSLVLFFGARLHLKGPVPSGVPPTGDSPSSVFFRVYLAACSASTFFPSSTWAFLLPDSVACSFSSSTFLTFALFSCPFPSPQSFPHQ